MSTENKTAEIRLFVTTIIRRRENEIRRLQRRACYLLKKAAYLAITQPAEAAQCFAAAQKAEKAMDYLRALNEQGRGGTSYVHRSERGRDRSSHSRLW